MVALVAGGVGGGLRVESEVVDDAWSARVSQTEQVVGTVMPAGQGKPPVHAAERRCRPGDGFELDVQTADARNAGGMEWHAGGGRRATGWTPCRAGGDRRKRT